MPKYELMYIIGSHVPDNEIGKVSEEVKTFIEKSQGSIVSQEDLGKKKLAYPIKKSRIGHYQLVNFTAPAEKLSEIEHRIRTSQAIIRHLILNMDEALVRVEKDRVQQAKLKTLRPKPEAKPEAGRKEGRKVVIDLDKEIEKALESPEELK